MRRPGKCRARWISNAIQVARTTHLYAGLLLIPWVFLYGITGFLFNHPSWFSGQLHRDFGVSELAGTSLDGLPTAPEMARDVVAQFNERFAARYELIQPERAALGRGGLNAAVELPDKTVYQLTIHANGSGGTIRPSRGGRAPGPGGYPGVEAPPFAVPGGLLIRDSPFARMNQGLPSLLEHLDLTAANVLSVQMTPLTFFMKDGRQMWEVHYTAESGAVTGRPVNPLTPTAAQAPSVRSFLTNLHKSHGYPADETNVRSVWAVLVDIMSAIMLMWGATGLWMWWQIKKTRRLGGICLGISIAAATWIGIGMHGLMLTH